MAKFFIDTNVLIYANDRRDPGKQKKAIRLLSHLMKTGEGVISTQVLQEYANVALTKLGQREEVVLRQLHLLEKMEVVRQSTSMIRRAVEIKKMYHINFWDAFIVSNAESAQCDLIYSEDLNTGQFFSGIRIENPFT
ncbi:MAG: PIN domain-containing protein [Spirochaetaceae bacterium]|nr:PIN domain-containing protein [Spirochaetaceae bacterium]MCF7939794.1 PIN domain-containing protein [Spirochaetales bacterium]